VIAKTVKDAIRLLDNASSQISLLRRAQVLQEYNKELVAWAQHREDKFIEEVPALFGQNFPRDVTEYLDQVASLKKAKVAVNPSCLGFYKPYAHRPTKKSYTPQKHRPASYPQVCPQGSHQQKKPRK